MVAALSGCHTTPINNDHKNKIPSHSPSLDSEEKVDNKIQTTTIEEKLRTAAADWYGTPYRYGGLSRNGIDCSGFVMSIYRDVLNIDIPRTTALQSSFGKKVSRSQLEPGDLVMFKTGWGKRHSGIYLGNGDFVHASSSRGVMISSINSNYWNKAYWMARRVM